MRQRCLGMICAAVLCASSALAQSRSGEFGSAGWKAIAEGDGDRAASAFRQAIDLQPRDASLHFGAGVAAHLQGRDRDAMSLLQRALAMEPRLTQAAELLGEIAYHEGELDRAIKTYEAAIASGGRSALSLQPRLEAWRTEAAVHNRMSTVKDDRFSVMFDGPVEQKLAIRATTVLGNGFWNIGKAIGTYPNQPINVIFYSSEQFRDITGAPEWAGGGFDGQIRMPVRGALRTPEQFDRALVHELTHAMVSQVASRNVPTWLHEGLAQRFDGERGAAATERAMQRGRQFIPLVQLQGSFAGLTEPQAALAYTESLFATSVLLEKIGSTGIGQLLQDLDRGEQFDGAIQRFGFTFADFERELVRRIGKR